MKNIRIVLYAWIICTLYVSEAFAQPDSITIKLTASGKQGQSIVIPLEFGIKKGATNGLDESLGERNRFHGFPPSGLDARFVFRDSVLEKNIYTYKDFRNFENTTRFTKKFSLGIAPGVTRQGDPNDNYKEFYFRWETLSPYIDSARILDRFDGAVININLKDGNEYLYTNELIDNLEIIVHFNMMPTSSSAQEQDKSDRSKG